MMPPPRRRRCHDNTNDAESDERERAARARALCNGAMMLSFMSRAMPIRGRQDVTREREARDDASER